MFEQHWHRFVGLVAFEYDNFGDGLLD